MKTPSYVSVSDLLDAIVRLESTPLIRDLARQVKDAQLARDRDADMIQSNARACQERADERDAAIRERDEACSLLRRMVEPFDDDDHAVFQIKDARAFLSRLDASTKA